MNAIIRIKSYQIYGQNMKMHKISLGYYVETISVYPFQALWQTLTLSSMKHHLRTEESVPIDAMLKANSQKITLF